MSYTYSLFEKALVYGPLFIAALAAVLVMSAGVFSHNTAGFLRGKIYKTAAALIFIMCAFIFLYTSKNADFIYGISVLKIRVLLLALAACLFVLVIEPDKGESGPYVTCLAALVCIFVIFIAEGPMLVLAAFIVMDCAVFAVVLLKKESAQYAAGLMPAKLLYAMACMVFAALFIFSSGKTTGMAQAGCTVFMILFSTPGLLALRSNDGAEGESFLHKNSAFILISGIITATAAAGFLAAAGGPVAARPIVIACVRLACVNIYRTIKEEKYQAFTAHDSINPVFLLPSLACGAALPAAGIALPAVLFMLSVFFQNEFISLHDHGRHTVTSLKYGFEKIKAAKLAFLGLVFGLAAEIWVFVMFYKYLKPDPLVFAAVIFMALAFSISMLNKIFMVFSMLKRFKLGLTAAVVLNKGNLRPVIFVFFTAALLVAWLK
jgi:hypothetical protein